MPQKGKTVLTLESRVEILERLDRGEKAKDLATEYGVTDSAISHIKSKKEDIVRQKRTLEQCGSSVKRKKYTGIEETPREQSMRSWLHQKRDIGDPVSGQILSETAKYFNEKAQGSPGFQASRGFLHKFKKRYEIQALSVQEEKLSADKSTSEVFCSHFRDVCKGLGCDLDQIYNAGETGLWWKMLPRKTLTASSEKQAPGRKLLKDRVTVMCCTNASGTHKIPLMVVGKSQRRRCFKNIKTLPVTYRGQNEGWSTKSLILDWYKSVFIQSIMERHGSSSKKVILVLDNAPGHPDIKEFEAISDICQVVYLPANVTSLIQPMGQGIIEEMKKIYRHNLLRLLLTAETEEGVTKLLKSINMLNVCNFLAFSWEQVSAGSIQKAWKKIFPLQTELPEYVEFVLSGRHILHMVHALPGYSDITEDEANDWLNVDVADPGWKFLSEEIVDDTQSEIADHSEEDSSGDEEDLDPMCTKEMLSNFNTIIAWCQTKWDCTVDEIQYLERLRNGMITDILVANNLR